MADPYVSPISQLLNTLGITREDLHRHSDQMRQFLTDSTPSRLSHRRRDITPPPIPPIPDNHEQGLPTRQYDAMELVIERQRRQNKKDRKSRKDREREQPRPISPSPSTASSQHSVSLDSFMQSRGDGRAQASSNDDDDDDMLPVTTPMSSITPVTPHKNKYYRPHTELSHSENASSETHTSAPTHLTPTSLHYSYHPYSAYGNLAPTPSLQSADASSSVPPVTPHTTRIRVFKSPLPPSSPPRSSPISSPARPVNLVSSPGPLGPAPDEDDYDNLPYTLPPGPYSTNKPDLSYAALVGQAILSSPEHRLTLQEIYDWITIVYPHFKRGETTWMNSIRHVLSTTVCFRKVPRDRSVGRTQWAIWDEDLECFKGGNFRKHLCKDYMKEVAAKEKLTKGKTRARKRTDHDDIDSRKSKRARKDQPSSPAMPPTICQVPSSSFAPLFPPTRPTPHHHQPYYQSCLPQSQTLPAEIIFPPLPPTSAFDRVLSQRNGTSTQSSSVDSSASSTREISPPQSAPDSSSSTPTTSSSVPGLTPNRHSSSSPSMPATSDMDLEGIADASTVCSIADSDSHHEQNDDDTDVLPLSGRTTLKPVSFWGDNSKETDRLEPSISLLASTRVVSECEDELLKSKAEAQRAISAQMPSLHVPPTSPTPERRAAKSVLPSRNADAGPSNRSMTPTLPSTPPSRHVQISSARTPLSHKGLHMSPTTSLAHYKSHLDPPPAVPFDVDAEQDPLRTPRKRRESMDGLPGGPMTPRKLFSSNSIESPFRTPNAFGMSPFSRTPRSRPILDPQDPRTLLDEELNRMGTLADSPDGLFGKSRSSLLYDSPGALDLPGKYRSWW